MTKLDIKFIQVLNQINVGIEWKTQAIKNYNSIANKEDYVNYIMTSNNIKSAVRKKGTNTIKKPIENVVMAM